MSMRKQVCMVLICVILVFVCVGQIAFSKVENSKKGQAPNTTEPRGAVDLKTEHDKLSYICGYTTANEIKAVFLKVEFQPNVELLIQGLKDGLTGRESLVGNAEKVKILAAVAKELAQAEKEAEVTKGAELKLTKGKRVPLEGLAEGTPDNCWLEYMGLSEIKGKDDSDPKSTHERWPTFVLLHKREGFDEGVIEIDRLSGRVSGKVLGATWKRQLTRPGQMLSSTTYDVYGRPEKTTRYPIETVFITVKFSIVDANDSQATVSLLSSSKVVSEKK